MSDSKYYWLKLKKDFFKRHDIRIVESMANGKDYILFYLKLLCESVDHDGNLRFSERIPYNADMLGTITNTNVDIVRNAIDVFTELGMMDMLDDGTLYMTEVSKMLGSASNNPNAIRQARHREKVSVTKSNALVTPAVTNNNESKNKSKSKNEIKDLVASLPIECQEVVNDFISMRKEIKAPVTARGLKGLIKKAHDYSKGNTDIFIKIFEQSIERSWKGVFPLKQDKSDNPFVALLENGYGQN